MSARTSNAPINLRERPDEQSRLYHTLRHNESRVCVFSDLDLQDSRALHVLHMRVRYHAYKEPRFEREKVSSVPVALHALKHQKKVQKR